MYNNLSDFINTLERQGELLRVTEEVSPRLEIGEIADRAMKRGLKAIVFESVKGYDMPVAVNMFGSMKRMAMALGRESVDDVAADIAKLIETKPPASLMEKALMLPRLYDLSKSFPVSVKSSPAFDVVYEGDRATFDILPVLTCHPGDGGPFITLPQVITKGLDGKRNMGMYRMQIFDSRTAGMHWHVHKTGAKQYAEYEKAGKRMEVAVVLGGDPAVTYSATAPLPDGFDELIFAGFLRKRPVETVKCRTVDLEVPADAEIVIEGYVDPRERRIEGPFGDHTGYYSPADEYPVFHLTCISHRKNAIYPATVVGAPPMEDCYMGKATERIFLPLIKTQLPEIADINLPVEGVFHNLAFVSIKKTYPMQARKTVSALWGMGQMMFTKLIVVFDEDVDVQNTGEVLHRLGANIDPKRDGFVSEGPVDVLDHASPTPLFGSKMGIDATRKLPGEGYEREWPEDIVSDPETAARIDAIWNRLGLE
ncbi:MAG: menaquinone biosynthesis decarboxylase [Abditibacteriota bacterium]|nr:menaquinone biosynthesis decarboxylase [Abditibacteriota bacterium]